MYSLRNDPYFVPQDNQPKSGVQGGFSASPRHHGGREPGRQSASKPFADGYQKGGPVKLEKKDSEQATEQQGEEEEGVSGHVDDQLAKAVCIFVTRLHVLQLCLLHKALYVYHTQAIIVPKRAVAVLLHLAAA